MRIALYAYLFAALVHLGFCRPDGGILTGIDAPIFPSCWLFRLGLAQYHSHRETVRVFRQIAAPPDDANP